MQFTRISSPLTKKLAEALSAAETILIGAGAGLSTSAGFTYSGERFDAYFSDFREKYGITDIYSGGFYPFETLEEYWAWWSRHIFYNRYTDAPKPVYRDLLSLVKNKNYFIVTAYFLNAFTFSANSRNAAETHCATASFFIPLNSSIPSSI